MFKLHTDAQNQSRLFSGFRVSRAALRNSLLLVLVACAASLALYLSPSSLAVSRTWDGGSTTTNNWSDPLNWSGDTVPVSGDDIIFDGTSTKNATIDGNFAVRSLNINTGYSGTITQADSTTLSIGTGGAFANSSQAVGTFVCGAGSTVSFNAVNFTQTGGQFNCQSGTINSGIFFNLAINGGTFIAPDGTMTIAPSNFTLGATGTFHSDGTVILTSSNVAFAINSADGTLKFNNLTVNISGSVSISAPAANKKLVSEGNLNLVEGTLNSRMEAKSNVTIAETFGSISPGTTSIGSGKLQLTGTLASPTRIVSLPTLSPNPNLLYMPIELDAPNTTINTNGAGPVKLSTLDLITGIFNAGPAPLSIGNSISFTPSTLSGGTFNCDTATISLNAVDFMQTGGQFNCQNGTINTTEFTPTINGGTFNAPSGVMTFGGGASDFRLGPGGTFNHNNGTIVAAGQFLVFHLVDGAPGTLVVNRLTVDLNHPSQTGFVGVRGVNDRLRILGTLNLIRGNIASDGAFDLSTFEAQGDVNVSSTFSGNTNGTGHFAFVGGNSQTFTNSGGVNPSGIWTLDKSGGTVTLASDLDLSNSLANVNFQILNLTNGTITTGNFTLNAGTRTVNRTNGYIIGKLRRNFGLNGSRTFAVGTANAFSPVTANVTSGINQGLTIGATQGTHPNLPATSLGRFWTVTEHGTVTADLTFQYLDTDINGSENNYRVAKIDNNVTFLTSPTATINTAANTFTVNNQNDFAAYTLGIPSLQISPANAQVQVQATQSFTASGGTTPFVFSLPINNSGGSINSSTGVYTAGTVASVQDTVRVTDSEGRTADAIVSVTPGAATGLGFNVQPTNTVQNETITPAVQVAIQDQFGHTVTTATDAVTIAISSNPSGGTLSGTLTQNAVGGIAAFNNLSINNAGDGYTLLGSSGSLTGATSNPFSIVSPFIVTSKNDSGTGTLRNAIIASNATAGTQTISFNLSQTLLPWDIKPTTELPALTDPVIIDGATQPGFNGFPIVRLDGTNLTGPAPKGLILSGGNSTVKGLSVVSFGDFFPLAIGSGILIASDGNTIQGNVFGFKDPIPTTLYRNGTGITVSGQNNLIGGTTSAERNVLSGNHVAVLIDSSSNMLAGNFFGTNFDGTDGLTGNTNGIVLSGVDGAVRNNTVRDNVISNNSRSISIANGGQTPAGNVVQNNIIKDGGREGIYVDSTTHGNRLTANRISNTLLGMKLDNGRTDNQGLTNDTQDPDEGANNQQNYPVLRSAVLFGNNTIVNGTLNSTPSSNFTLEFFSSPSCGASGWGEGETFLGSSNVTTDAGGIVGFATNLPVTVASGRVITATATDANGNTSEFSKCRAVAAANFTISGRATGENSVPLEHTQLQLSGSSTALTITDEQGNYSFDNLPSGGNYTVTVTRPNYNFTPPSRSYTNLLSNRTDQNFSGSPERYSVEGRARTMVFVPNLTETALPGKRPARNTPHRLTGPHALGRVTYTLTGPVTRTFVSDRSGEYGFSNLEPGDYTITPSKPNFTFSPPAASFTISNFDLTIDFSGESLGLADFAGRIVYEKSLGIEMMNGNGSGEMTLIRPRGEQVSVPDLSAGGSQLVYLSRTFNNSFRSLVTRNSDGSGPRSIFGDEGIRSPVWSPDGSRIAFDKESGGAFSQSIFFINADGSGLTERANGCAEPDWSPDSTKLVCIAPDIFSSQSVILVYDLLSGAGPTQIDGPAGRKISPKWSPDGAQIAFINRSAGTSSIILADPIDPISTTILTDSGNVYGELAWSPDGSKLAAIRSTGSGGIGSTKQLVGVFLDGGTILISDGFGGANIDWSGSNDVPTPAGSTVTIQSGHVSMTFTGVGTANAVTTITRIAPGTAGTVPNGFQVGNLAFEISTTANFTPPLMICIDLDGPISPFNLIKGGTGPTIMHNENGVLRNIATSYDPSTHVVCGEAFSLSPFVIAHQIDPALPSITGLVLDSTGIPMSGVSIDLTETETSQIETDSDGIFRLVNLTAGGNYNVQPRKEGYLFNEYSQDFVNVTGENTVVFTGTAASFDISGQALDVDGNPISDVQISLEWSSSAVTTTDANGHYSFADLPADGSFLLIPFKSGLVFAPPQSIIEPLTSDHTIDFISQPCAAASISSQPSPQIACPNSLVSFVVTATGTNLTYQWRKNGSPLSNGGNISGADTATLTINPTGVGDEASYDVIVSDGCGSSETSSAVSLTVSDFTLSSTTQFFPTAGGSGSVNVINGNSCLWTAVSNDSFIHVTSGGSGSGNGTVAFTVDATPSPRTGTMTIAGQTFTVDQNNPTAAPASISGRITTPEGSPLGGTVMHLSGALSRTTISDGNGNYHFDNLDTENFYTVTPELVNYQFAPASRSFSLVGNMTDVGFTANPDATQSANAIDTVEYFLRQQYLDFLGREPDQGGLEYWSSQFTPCNGDATCIRNKRIDVSAAFFASLEFQETGSYIYGLYAGTLGRTPGYGEFMPDRAQVVGGAGLDPAKTAFAQNFVQRAEFTNRYPQSLTREQFVDAVIQTMSTRSGVDHSSLRNGLLSDYDAGGRALVARHASEASAFVAAEYNRAFVLMEYFGYLRRDVDPGGYAFWLDVLNRGAGSRGMVCAFLTSTEYQHRFSTVVTHNNGECQ